MTQSTQFSIPQRILTASPYVPEWLGLDRSSFIRLDRNESTHPLPTEIQEALTTGIQNCAVQSYPEPALLLESLAEYVGLPPEYLLTTNGSDQGIDLCLRALLNETSSLMIARPEFAVFSHVAETIGAVVQPVPYNDDLSFPYRAFTDAIISMKPDLIVLINPNNPTGSEIDVDYIRGTVAANPGTPVVVDEAYYEFTGQTVVPLVPTHPNLIILRTFSKAFAMAGLRLGYVIANPDVLTQVRKLQNPFDVNQLAVIAGLAQLRRREKVLEDARHAIEQVKRFVVESLLEEKVELWPGSANFVLVRPPDCARAVAYLRNGGILVRSMSAPALQGTFRVSLGTMHEMQRFIDVFRSHMRSADL